MAKKLICLLLALMMMLTVAVSCKNGDPASKDTEGGTTPTGTTTEKEIYVSSTVEDPDEPDGVLIANEGTSKYVIVRGENASPSEVTAANELQSCLKKITNVELVVTDATAETKYAKTQIEEAYVQFNTALKDKMVSYNCLHINENASYDLVTMEGSLNLANPPCYWYPWR